MLFNNNDIFTSVTETKKCFCYTHKQNEEDMIMGKLILTLCMMFFISSMSAQRADMRIKELLDKADYFTLEEEYPSLKDSVQTVILKLFAKTMIDYNFNLMQLTLEDIRELVINHQRELGFENTANLVSLTSLCYGRLGNYANAADNLKNFLDQVKSMGLKDGLSSFEEMYVGFDELQKFPAPNISRPERDVEIPISIEPFKVSKSVEPTGVRGTHLYLPVTIHGKEYKFILDTGSSHSFIPERLAKDMKLHVFKDSVIINKNTENISYGMNAYLDSMQIGDITYRNVIVCIPKTTVAVDNIAQVDAILGLDFILLMKELQIYPKEKKIIFPVKYTSLPETGRNLMLRIDNHLILKVYGSNNERLLFHLDTGNKKADLFYSYYSKHKAEIDSKAVKSTITGGGLGYVETKEILHIPSISLKIGDIPAEIKDIRVNPVAGNNKMQDSDIMLLDGAMGMDLINIFPKIVINLKDMFMSF